MHAHYIFMYIGSTQEVFWQIDWGSSGSNLVFSPEFWNRGVQGVKSKALVLSPAPILHKRHYCTIDCCVLESIYLVVIIEYQLALHAMTLMGGAAASETLLVGCNTPQEQPRENAEAIT